MMLNKTIKKELFDITPVEHEQIINHGKNIVDVPPEEISPDSVIKMMPYWHFFDQGRIAVTQSNRFSYIPAHRHRFIEMNYCYSGRSIQYVDDNIITLHPGHLLIMDRDIQQRINYARKQDILLNILIRDDYEVSNLLQGINAQQNILTQFLANTTKHNFNHNNFLVFDLNKDVVAKQLIENIICKGINNDGSNNLLLENMMKSFILSIHSDLVLTKKVNFTSKDQNKNLQILEYINEHYRDLTLKSLAKEFGYNPNYLGNLITSTSGHTFKELLQMRRLNIACNLLQNTNYSIEDISDFVGYDNHSSLFRLFKKYLGITPQEYRTRIQIPRDLDDESNVIPNPYFK